MSNPAPLRLWLSPRMGALEFCGANVRLDARTPVGGANSAFLSGMLNRERDVLNRSGINGQECTVGAHLDNRQHH